MMSDGGGQGSALGCAGNRRQRLLAFSISRCSNNRQPHPTSSAKVRLSVVEERRRRRRTRYVLRDPTTYNTSRKKNPPQRTRDSTAAGRGGVSPPPHHPPPAAVKNPLATAGRRAAALVVVVANTRRHQHCCGSAPAAATRSNDDLLLPRQQSLRDIMHAADSASSPPRGVRPLLPDAASLIVVAVALALLAPVQHRLDVCLVRGRQHEGEQPPVVVHVVRVARPEDDAPDALLVENPPAFQAAESTDLLGEGSEQCDQETQEERLELSSSSVHRGGSEPPAKHAFVPPSRSRYPDHSEQCARNSPRAPARDVADALPVVSVPNHPKGFEQVLEPLPPA